MAVRAAVLSLALSVLAEGLHIKSEDVGPDVAPGEGAFTAATENTTISRSPLSNRDMQNRGKFPSRVTQLSRAVPKAFRVA